MSAPRVVRVAGAQYPLDPAVNLAAWSGKAERWVADAAARGAALLVFPEYGALEAAAIAGPAAAADLQASLAAAADAVPAMEGEWRRLAARHRVHILAPSGPERRRGDFVNAARLVTPAGAVGVQEKLVLTPFERAWGIAPGGRLRVFETGLGRIGIALCYDSEFPLIVRAQAEAGAEVILVPSCTETPSGHQRVRSAARARALESQVATVTSHTVGAAPWSPAIDKNTGAAGIFVPPDPQIAPSGIIAEGEADAPAWIVGDIDLAALARVRAAGEVRNHADWARQPGAAPLAGHVEVVRLG